VPPRRLGQISSDRDCREEENKNDRNDPAHQEAYRRIAYRGGAGSEARRLDMVIAHERAPTTACAGT
jgi:hypothetical protein